MSTQSLNFLSQTLFLQRVTAIDSVGVTNATLISAKRRSAKLKQALQSQTCVSKFSSQNNFSSRKQMHSQREGVHEAKAKHLLKSITSKRGSRAISVELRQTVVLN
jgi:hypothetical protein